MLIQLEKETFHVCLFQKSSEMEKITHEFYKAWFSALNSGLYFYYGIFFQNSYIL